MFYGDPRVLYFSIHRYEHGTFWPNLRESDFDYVGDGKGAGYNFNVPLNKTGMTNADYLAIWQQILVPVATEVFITNITAIDFRFIEQILNSFHFITQFQPNLIIVSAGYDAAFGCPEVCFNYLSIRFSHFTFLVFTQFNNRICWL